MSQAIAHKIASTGKYTSKLTQGLKIAKMHSTLEFLEQIKADVAVSDALCRIKGTPCAGNAAVVRHNATAITKVVDVIGGNEPAGTCGKKSMVNRKPTT